MQPLHLSLKTRVPQVAITKLIIAANILVFAAMLLNGAGIWHSPNAIQLAWGANFGPATQDGEWWRLGTAMFLHFGVIHLLINVWSLWDAGQLVERMYGHLRFACIYMLSGLSGNLVSLVIQGDSAVSGGASGAIFGVYGALLTFLWLERKSLTRHEFRWLFWGASVFSVATIIFGFIVPGIDNSAHIGGFLTGILSSIVFSQSFEVKTIARNTRLLAGGAIVLAFVILVINIPTPKYRWSDELLVRKKVDEFLLKDQAINRSWLQIMHEGNNGEATFDSLAEHIDEAISEPYEQSFEQLSQLPNDPALPSAAKLQNLLQYVEKRKSESQVLADKIRSKPIMQLPPP
ncbi:MAG: rhomboid family intramembrane serine protease [Methylotenera sp.]|uniref:rhomboid family intramembrane serine protease n=1 Tax=Methylotenera sp. TaxID=2051956 RepID=UPI002489C1DB|nr:rhomboid family intramembrane serine protease [Methylotenera sp.]MDI1308319.1 rhomboid family intramembrane serine protease [Methylotenera sp.]